MPHRSVVEIFDQKQNGGLWPLSEILSNASRLSTPRVEQIIHLVDLIVCQGAAEIRFELRHGIIQASSRNTGSWSASASSRLRS